MSRTLNIINIFLGTAIIAAAAWIATDTLSFQRAGRVKTSPSPRVSSPVPTTIDNPADLSHYEAIITTGLFGSAMKGQLTPFVSSTAVKAQPVALPAELVLLGTATGSSRESFALLRHTARQEERVFRLGDMVFDTGRLVEVTRERIVIEINGKRVELLPPLASPPAAPAAAPHPVPAATVSATGTGSYSIDQRALNAALENPTQAMSDARLLPSTKEGKTEGFRASEVRPGGVFSMMGIRNGDVLLRLNDFAVDSPDKALQSFIALKGQNHLKLDIIRDGHPQTLNYDIR